MAQSWLRDQPPGPALGTAAGRELEAASIYWHELIRYWNCLQHFQGSIIEEPWAPTCKSWWFNLCLPAIILAQQFSQNIFYKQQGLIIFCLGCDKTIHCKGFLGVFSCCSAQQDLLQPNSSHTETHKGHTGPQKPATCVGSGVGREQLQSDQPQLCPQGKSESTKFSFFSILEGRKLKTFVLLERCCCFQRKCESAEAVLKKKQEEDSYLSSRSPPAILLPSPLVNSPVLLLTVF